MFRGSDDLLEGIYQILFAASIAWIVITTWFPGFGNDILHWLKDLLFPAGAGAARAIGQALGALAVFAALTAAYFSAGRAGGGREADYQGVLGIIAGFAVLVFTAAHLCRAGLTAWAGLAGGIAASLLVSFLLVWRRTRRLRGKKCPAGSEVSTAGWHDDEDV